MRVTVLGAGAVGGYFGARLAARGVPVTFWVRPARADALRERGLVVQSPYGDLRIAAPRVVTDVRFLEASDVMLVAVKNYHLPAVLDDLARLAADGTRVLPLLNGIEHYDLLDRRLGRAQVLGATAQIFAALDANGEITHVGPLHHLTVGPRDASQDALVRELAALCGAAGVPCQVSEDIVAAIWSKFAMIVALAGVTAAARITLGQLATHAAAEAVFQKALEEVRALAAAEGVTLPDTMATDLAARIHTLPASATTSMYEDLRHGRPLELDALLGAAMRRAVRSGVALPTVETLYGLLAPWEHGEGGA